MNTQVASAPSAPSSAFIKSITSSGGLLFVGFAVLIAVFAIASPVFLTAENFANIGRQTTLVSIMAVGMTLVIVSGEFDLSVGSTMALAGVVGALAMQNVGDVWLVGAVVALLTGAAVGLVNGVLTTWLSIPSFLITLGSLSIGRGLALLVTGTRPINILDETFHLHLRLDHIRETWAVRKPTKDGHVTSIEAYGADGEMIIQFFGQREEGSREREDWRFLVENLPRIPVAATL